MPKQMHFDPFPFQFLTLTVSLEAIFLLAFILINQNRQSRVSDRRNHLDLQINLLSEQENSKMMSMLAAISKHLGIDESDPEIGILQAVQHSVCKIALFHEEGGSNLQTECCTAILQEATEPGQLAEQIDQILEKSAHTGEKTSAANA